MSYPRPSILITIDTERDMSAGWKTPSSLTFRSVVEAIPNIIEPLCVEFGMRPTYFLSPEVIVSRECADVMRSQASCELATHLHGEYVVPEIAGWRLDDPALVIDDMQHEYPSDLERAKLETLTELFYLQFDRRPVSFRAGRFGIGSATGKHLIELGYKVDSSVTPHIYWVNSRGEPRPDFTRAEETPYFIDEEGDLLKRGNSSLLEVPLTVLPPGAIATHAASQPAWLRPRYLSKESISLLLEKLCLSSESDQFPRPLVIMFHSTELVAGASPYSATEDDVALYVDILRHIFSEARRCGAVPATMGEFFEAYRDFHRKKESRNTQRKGLSLSRSEVVDALVEHGAPSWFHYIYAEREQRWDVWEPCMWVVQHLPSTSRVLSIGCGVGFNLMWFAEQGFSSLEGFDPDPRVIASGKAIARRCSLPLKLWVDDGISPRSIPQGRYDVIEALNWMHLIPDFSYRDFLHFWASMLNSDGVFIFDIICDSFNSVVGNQYLSSDLAKPEHQRAPSEYKMRMNPEAIESLCKTMGLAVVTTFKRAEYVPRLVFVVRKVGVVG